MHKELLLKAKSWLAGTNRCNPVFIERGSQRLCEFPDAIGWDAHECIVVECKASLDDFRADKKKACRNGGGLGSKRYFMVPAALQEAVEKELPEGWGLVVMNEHGIVNRVRFKDSANHERNHQAEVFFLRSRILEIQRFGT